jgi:hypothetical protein
LQESQQILGEADGIREAARQEAEQADPSANSSKAKSAAKDEEEPGAPPRGGETLFLNESDMAIAASLGIRNILQKKNEPNVSLDILITHDLFVDGHVSERSDADPEKECVTWDRVYLGPCGLSPFEWVWVQNQDQIDVYDSSAMVSQAVNANLHMLKIQMDEAVGGFVHYPLKAYSYKGHLVAIVRKHQKKTLDVMARIPEFSFKTPWEKVSVHGMQRFNFHCPGFLGSAAPRAWSSFNVTKLTPIFKGLDQLGLGKLVQNKLWVFLPQLDAFVASFLHKNATGTSIAWTYHGFRELLDQGPIKRWRKVDPARFVDYQALAWVHFHSVLSERRARAAIGFRIGLQDEWATRQTFDSLGTPGQGTWSSWFSDNSHIIIPVVGIVALLAIRKSGFKLRLPIGRAQISEWSPTGAALWNGIKERFSSLGRSSEEQSEGWSESLGSVFTVARTHVKAVAESVSGNYSFDSIRDQTCLLTHSMCAWLKQKSSDCLEVEPPDLGFLLDRGKQMLTNSASTCFQALERFGESEAGHLVRATAGAVYRHFEGLVGFFSWEICMDSLIIAPILEEFVKHSETVRNNRYVGWYSKYLEEIEFVKYVFLDGHPVITRAFPYVMHKIARTMPLRYAIPFHAFFNVWALSTQWVAGMKLGSFWYFSMFYWLLMLSKSAQEIWDESRLAWARNETPVDVGFVPTPEDQMSFDGCEASRHSVPEFEFGCRTVFIDGVEQTEESLQAFWRRAQLTWPCPEKGNAKGVWLLLGTGVPLFRPLNTPLSKLSITFKYFKKVPCARQQKETWDEKRWVLAPLVNAVRVGCRRADVTGLFDDALLQNFLDHLVGQKRRDVVDLLDAGISVGVTYKTPSAAPAMPKVDETLMKGDPEDLYPRNIDNLSRFNAEIGPHLYGSVIAKIFDGFTSFKMEIGGEMWDVYLYIAKSFDPDRLAELYEFNLGSRGIMIFVSGDDGLIRVGNLALETDLRCCDRTMGDGPLNVERQILWEARMALSHVRVLQRLDEMFVIIQVKDYKIEIRFSDDPLRPMGGRKTGSPHTSLGNSICVAAAILLVFADTLMDPDQLSAGFARIGLSVKVSVFKVFQGSTWAGICPTFLKTRPMIAQDGSTRFVLLPSRLIKVLAMKRSLVKVFKPQLRGVAACDKRHKARIIGLAVLRAQLEHFDLDRFCFLISWMLPQPKRHLDCTFEFPHWFTPLEQGKTKRECSWESFLAFSRKRYDIGSKAWFTLLEMFYAWALRGWPSGHILHPAWHRLADVDYGDRSRSWSDAEEVSISSLYALEEKILSAFRPPDSY